MWRCSRRFLWVSAYFCAWPFWGFSRCSVRTVSSLAFVSNSLLKYSFAITWGKNHQVTFSRTLDYYFEGRLPLEDSKLSVSPNFTCYFEHSVHLYGFVWAYYLYSTVLPIFTVEWKGKPYKMAEEGKQTTLLGLNNSSLFSIFPSPTLSPYRKG